MQLYARIITKIKTNNCKIQVNTLILKSLQKKIKINKAHILINTDVVNGKRPNKTFSNVGSAKRIV